jgi:preprotein translocase subunit YajC
MFGAGVNDIAYAMGTSAPGGGGTGGAGTGSSGFLSLIPMYIILAAIFYFLLIRPQRRKQKEHTQMLSNIKKNDEVVTIGGIYGTVVNVKEQSVVLRVDDNVKIEFQKSAIAAVRKRAE